MAIEEWVKMRLEGNSSFLTFWAILFFTCVVGVIELLPEVKSLWQTGDSVLFILISGLYASLIVGMWLCIYSCVRIIRENVNFILDGRLGKEFIEHAKNYPTISDKLLCDQDRRVRKRIELYLSITIGVCFTLLYLAKVGLLSFQLHTLLNFEVFGLICEIVGSSFLLYETIEFRIANQRLMVNLDESRLRKATRIRILGIVILMVGFSLQLIGTLLRSP